MSGKNRIIIKKSTNKQKYVVLKSANNKTIANTETYKSNQSVDKAVKALKKIVKNAIIVDQTKKEK
ncbi:TPA: hypothetical protein DEP30_02270 [Candidatus Nomurabacteria bacterium]|nr:MAG: hypothetical protein UR97_C0003G0038 [Candidatus Nomurabacteria bacterium GW2011_GWE2_36_115]KKP94094.1 MAG: hypothetical protein US00_C0003G0018 [Candidatus Nomurabacteria bacterium GW2011_GWF2_36_126]KKP96778.1 MAG: hypothetical protein US04_C0001G0280 [Candidatus Nomurabacteria bacterium GW2011_GWD2_36_14]KKP99618.1 MAG: hypothetical protein US08_C0001G0301 [Candidatus Nomurabacteria bacterium GW2011_GWF2_36_19]KKQ05466.1 MAG: hypothetical protein US17_C0004G0038 [Candidatus Nomuraba